MRLELPFTAGCLFELALLLLAFLWGWLFQHPLLSDIEWNLKAVLVGTIAAIPPFAFFFWTLHSKLQLFSRHRNLLESLLPSLFGKWSVLQLLVISLIAGISEEALFRGAIQGSLTERADMIFAVVLASALFGAFHLLTWTYAVIAALIGAYLGLLWIWTGNLLTPMVTHAVYDFAALCKGQAGPAHRLDSTAQRSEPDPPAQVSAGRQVTPRRRDVNETPAKTAACRGCLRLRS